MATLEGKTVLVVGGSSGIGYGVAKLSLLSLASKVIIASSSAAKVESALARLEKEEGLEVQVSGSGSKKKIVGSVSGEVVDARDSASVKALLARVGEIDHLVWTSGDPLDRGLGFPNIDIDANKDVFDVRFWGALTASQFAEIRPGGSITLTSGQVIVKPRKGWSLISGVAGAIDSLVRGLALDLAPTRVNLVSPGLVRTELFESHPPEIRNGAEEHAKNLLVGHIGEPDDVAEAYLFCMKCQYITGQRIEVDGGGRYL